jgi:hypothetical protein
MPVATMSVGVMSRRLIVLGGLFSAICGTMPAQAHDVRRTPLVISEGGTPENPAIFDGQGIIVDLGTDITSAAWKRDGDVWTLEALPGRALPIIAGQCAALFVDEQPVGVPRDLEAEKSRPDRKSRCYMPPDRLAPGQAGFTPDGGLYFRWPTGKDPAGSRLILPPAEGTSAVTVACGHVIVRNITARYAANDGFNIHGRWKGIVLEDVRALSNGDEGISAHDDVEMKVLRAEVAWNGSTAGGVADVNRCTTAYEDCVVHDNAGAAFYFSGKKHTATRCRIFRQAVDFRIAPESDVMTSLITWDRD